jgi:hypothetical protein
MKELTQSDFYWKLGVVAIPYLATLFGALLSFGRSWSPGLVLERDSIMKGKGKIRELQTSIWAVNASQVQNFTAISVAAVLIVVAYMIEKELNLWYETYLIIVVTVVGASCLSNAFSLQFWYCALDRFPNPEWLLRRRKIATTLQVIGWHGIYLGVVLCVSLADTLCGVLISVAGTCGLLLTMWYKSLKIGPGIVVSDLDSTAGHAGP